MRLKDDDFAPVRPVFLQCLERGLNFSGMVPVIVNDRNPVFFSFHLQSALNPIHGFQGFFNMIEGNIQFHCHGNAGGGIIYVVDSGKIELNFSQLLPVMIYAEFALLIFKFDIPDLIIRLGIHAVGGIAFFYPRNNILDCLIIQTEYGQTVKRNAIQKLQKNVFDFI